MGNRSSPRYRTGTAIRALTGERDLAVGVVACLQTHGSLANWHPHLHLLVTDGGFRPDGTFVSWLTYDAEEQQVTCRSGQALSRNTIDHHPAMAAY